MNQSLKSILMIAAIVIGVIFAPQIRALDLLTGEALAPLLLFSMLFITFCCVDLRDLRFSMQFVWMILFQLIMGVGSYYLLLPFGEIFAQGVMICFVTPVAMAAVVIVQLLGGNVVTIASFSMICNIVMAIFIPVFFTHIGGAGCTFGLILSRVAPLMVFPPLVAQLLRRVVPSVTSWFGSRGYISFYLWLVSLVITIGRTTTFIELNMTTIELRTGIILAASALVVCLIQYRVGRLIGRKYGDKPAAEQSLGQKNTILAIWLTQTFLSPIASIVPTAYVIWQNLTNSYKLFRYNSRK